MKVSKRYIISCASAVAIAGCNTIIPGQSDGTSNPNYYLVASPEDSRPEDGPVTEVDDPKIKDVEIIQDIIAEAVQKAQRIDYSISGEERKAVTELIDTLPSYDQFEDSDHPTGVYITTNSDIVRLFYESEGI